MKSMNENIECLCGSQDWKLKRYELECSKCKRKMEIRPGEAFMNLDLVVSDYEKALSSQ